MLAVSSATRSGPTWDSRVCQNGGGERRAQQVGGTVSARCWCLRWRRAGAQDGSVDAFTTTPRSQQNPSALWGGASQSVSPSVRREYAAQNRSVQREISPAARKGGRDAEAPRPVRDETSQTRQHALAVAGPMMLDAARRRPDSRERSANRTARSPRMRCKGRHPCLADRTSPFDRRILSRGQGTALWLTWSVTLRLSALDRILSQL